MLNAGFQYLEQRDANNAITKDGVVGKNSPFATSDNSGIYDIIAEDLRWLKENVDDVKDTSELEAIKQSVTDMYNDMKNNSSFGEAAAKAQAEEAKKQAQAALESATNAKTYRDDVVSKSTEANETLAEIKEYIDKAEKLVDSNKELEQSTSDNATVASNKANEASTSATNAKTSETNAATSATNAENSAVNAKLSETSAKDYASKAKISESNAKTSETNAATSAANAKTSETNASASKSNAATSESNAKSYMDTAKEYMQKAQEALAAAQAIQSIVDTAKANAEKCLADVEAVRDSLAKMITYQGSVDNYSDLPTNPQIGYSYNVKNADKEHGVNAGDNVVWNGTDWDNFGGAIDMSLFAELGKDVNFSTVRATLFTGYLNGNANTATTAINDKDGADIAETYLKKAGDTTTGKITFGATDLNALPEVNKTSDDNMSGIRFSSKTKFLGAVGKRLSNGEDLLNLRSNNTTTDVVLDSRNYNNYAPTKTGTGASGTWGIDISGNASTADAFSKTGNELGMLLWNMFHRYGANYVPSDTSNKGWNSLGLCIIYYAQMVIDHQPGQYGQLINIPADLGQEATQIWIEQSSGIIYSRGGNASVAINNEEFVRRG